MSIDTTIPFRDRLQRRPEEGALYDGEIRYLTMRPDALMGMFARLDEPARSATFEALAASVAEHGGRSIAAYFAANPGDADALLRVIAATSADLGWGHWQIERTGDGLEVAVANSPFAILSAKEPVCAPIRGILTALASHLPGTQVEETCCRASSGGNTCRFTVRPRQSTPQPTV